MNFKRTASIGVLLLGISFFNIKSANAKNVFESPVSKPSTNTAQSSSYTIAQLLEANSPVYGAWKLTFSNNGIVHESILVMKGYYGVMRTQYFSPISRKTEVIDQAMELKSSSKGLVLIGRNPVYAGTSRRHPSYSPDNFLFTIQPNGSVQILTCDNASRCSSVDLQAIK